MASTEELLDAEAKYVDQASLVDGLFQCYHSSKRSAYWNNRNSKSKHNLKDFWSAVTGKVVQPSSIRSVLSSEGVLKTDKDDVKSEVEKHFCNIFKGSMEPIPLSSTCNPSLSDHVYSAGTSPSPLFDHSYSTRKPPHLPRIESSCDLDKNPSNWLARDFSVDEIKNIAAKLSNGKAMGLDNIPPEFLKNSPPEMFEVLTEQS